MAGHNKWSKIKRKKGVADARRSKIFSKLIKDITVAVKEGQSGDPDFNPRLRLAIANAKGVNMPKDNIERAIKKAEASDGAAFTHLTYEGYAQGGVAVFVECATDNLNRTIANVRAIFSKRGGSLATNGSVAFLFERKGIFVVPQGEWEEDDFMMEIIDGGAEDVELEDGEFHITCAFEDFGNMQSKLEELKMEAKSANLERIPTTHTALDVESSKKVLTLIEHLEDDDDIQAVFHNLEMTEELAKALETEEE